MTHHNRAISVVVPVYQVAPYLRRCVTSLFAQTFRDFSIVLVDDGSTDGGAELCDELAREDERVICIHQDNLGLSAARNAGIDAVHSEFIAFVDADDFVDEAYLARMYEAAVSRHSDVVQCGFRGWDEGASAPNARRSLLDREMELSGLDALNRLIREHPVEDVVAWNKLYRRELFDSVRFPHGRFNEDEFAIPQVFAIAERVTYLPDRLYWYVRREGSIMACMSEACTDIVDAYAQSVLLVSDVAPELELAARAAHARSCAGALTRIAKASGVPGLAAARSRVLAQVDVSSNLTNPELSVKSKARLVLSVYAPWAFKAKSVVERFLGRGALSRVRR